MASFGALPTELLLDIVLCLNSPMALFNMALLNKSFNSMFMPLFLFSQEPLRVGSDGDAAQGIALWQHVALIFPLITWGTNMPMPMRSQARGRTRVANALSGLYLYFDLEQIDHLECRFSPTTFNHTPAASLFRPYLQGLALVIRRLKKIRRVDIYFDSESRIKRELASLPLVLDSLEDDVREIFGALMGKGCEELNIFDQSLYTLGCERSTWWSHLESTIPQSPLRGRRPAQEHGLSRRGILGKDNSKIWKGIIGKPRKQLSDVLSLVKVPTGKAKGKKANSQHVSSPINPSPISLSTSAPFSTGMDSPYAISSPERPLPPLPADATNSLSLRSWNISSSILLRHLIRDDLQLTLRSSAHTLTKLVLSHLSGPPLRFMPKIDDGLNFFLKHFPKDNVLEELVVEWCCGITVPAFVGFLAKCQKLQTLSFDRTIPFLDLFLDEEASKEHPAIHLPRLQTLQAPTDWLLLILHVPHKWHLRDGDGPNFAIPCWHGHPLWSPNGTQLELGVDAPSTVVSPSPVLKSLTLLTRTRESIYFVYRQCAPVIDAVLAAVEPVYKGGLGQDLMISVDVIFATMGCLDCDVEALASRFDLSSPISATNGSVKPNKSGLGSFKSLKGNMSTRIQNLRRMRHTTRPKASSTTGIDLGWVELEDLEAEAIPNPSPLWSRITRLILPNKALPPIKSTGIEWWRAAQGDVERGDVRTQLNSLARWVISLFPGVVDVEMMCPPSVETQVRLAAEDILARNGAGYDYWDWNGPKVQRGWSRSSSWTRCGTSAQPPIIIQQPPMPIPFTGPGGFPVNGGQTIIMPANSSSASSWTRSSSRRRGSSRGRRRSRSRSRSSSRSRRSSPRRSSPPSRMGWSPERSRRPSPQNSLWYSRPRSVRSGVSYLELGAAQPHTCLIIQNESVHSLDYMDPPGGRHSGRVWNEDRHRSRSRSRSRSRPHSRSLSPSPSRNRFPSSRGPSPIPVRRPITISDTEDSPPIAGPSTLRTPWIDPPSPYRSRFAYHRSPTDSALSLYANLDSPGSPIPAMIPTPVPQPISVWPSQVFSPQPQVIVPPSTSAGPLPVYPVVHIVPPFIPPFIPPYSPPYSPLYPPVCVYPGAILPPNPLPQKFEPSYQPERIPPSPRTRARGIETGGGWEEIGEQMIILKDILMELSRRASIRHGSHDASMYAWETVRVGERLFCVGTLENTRSAEKKDIKGKGKAKEP